MTPRSLRFLPGLALLALAGCHSAFVQARVVNTTAEPLRLFEVDYPTASFGSGDLAPAASFRYRFKVLGDGPTKLTWTDRAGKDHTSNGPALQEGTEGDLTIEIGREQATWTAHLHHK